MKVGDVPSIGVLVGDEARELTGRRAVIGAVGGVLNLLPSQASCTLAVALGTAHIRKSRRTRVGHQHPKVVGAVGELEVPPLGAGIGRVARPLWLRADLDLAQEFSVLRHAEEIERSIDGGRSRRGTGRVREHDCLAARVGEGILSGEHRAVGAGIEGVLGVSVEVTP